MSAGPLPEAVVAEFLARCRAERAAAGLPLHVTDPAVLDRIAAIVASGGPSTTGDDRVTA